MMCIYTAMPFVLKNRYRRDIIKSLKREVIYEAGYFSYLVLTRFDDARVFVT